MDTQHPLYFAEEFIERLLAEEHVVLTKEQRQLYVPQLSAIVEEEVGGELMKRLDDRQLGEFGKLFSNSSTTDEEWNKFWHESIPNFQEVVDGCIEACGTKLRTLLKQDV